MTRVVNLCIYLLMSIGLWPCFWRPFRKHRTKQSILVMYSGIWMLLYVYNYIVSLIATIQMKQFKSFGSILLQELGFTVSFVLKLAIIHVSFKFNNLSRYMKGRNKEINLKATVCLIIPMIMIQFCVTYSTFRYTELVESASIYPENPTAIQQFAHYSSVLVMFISGILYFPTALLLACGILFKTELDSLSRGMTTDMYSLESCPQRNFQSLRQSFHNISQRISCTESVFKCYNITLLISIGVHLVSNIYVRTVSCSKLYPLDLYFAHLGHTVLAFLVPCVSGHLVSSSVSFFCP